MHIVSIFNFAQKMVSIAGTQLCCWSMEIIIGNIETSGRECVPRNVPFT